MSGLSEYLAGGNDGPGGQLPPARMTAIGRPGGAYVPSVRPSNGRFVGRLADGGEFDGSYQLRHKRFLWIVNDFGETITIRQCNKCRRWLDRDTAFSVRLRVAGVASQWESVCKPCRRVLNRAYYAKIGRTDRTKKRRQDYYRRLMADPERANARRAKARERAAERRATNPEAVKAAQKRWRDKIIKDPVRREQRNSDARMNYRLRNGGSRRNIQTRFNQGQPIPSLPAAPLAAAIERLIETEAHAVFAEGPRLVLTGENGTPMPPLPVREGVCDRLSISVRSLYAWGSGERATVQFDVADRVLTSGGWCWWDIWSPCAKRCGECADCEAAQRAQLGFEGEAAA